MGSNFGTMLFVPLLNVLAGSIGMPMGSVICGGVAAVVGVIGMALLRDTPKERGLYPDNVTEAEFKANYSSPASCCAPRRPGCALCPPAF